MTTVVHEAEDAEQVPLATSVGGKSQCPGGNGFGSSGFIEANM